MTIWEISRTGLERFRQADRRKAVCSAFLQAKKKELARFVRDYEAGDGPCTTFFQGRYYIQPQIDYPLTEIREGDLYFCLEQRLVTVRDQIIPLTVKEFEIFALLILKPKAGIHL